MKEWDYLSERMKNHDDQMGNIRNWCIIALTGLIGFILSQNEREDGILLLPFFVISFFMINEMIKQIWKWKAIIRLYELERALRERHIQTGQYEPSIVTNEVREKLKKQLNDSSDVSSRTRIAFINTIFAVNFAVFYGLLFLLYSLFSACQLLFEGSQSFFLIIWVDISPSSFIKQQILFLEFAKGHTLLFLVTILSLSVSCSWLFMTFLINFSRS